VVLAVAASVLLSGCNMFAEKQYTILLHTFSGPDHVPQSKHFRDKTEELAKWEDLELVHKDSHSELYRGRYVSMRAAEGDLRTARVWRAPNVNRCAFPYPRVVLIPGKEIGKPEHNLVNAKGHWTILVALFVDDPDSNFVGRDRQQDAVTYCEWLRNKGYEAYYHHISGRSQVTVGTFPEDAVVMQAHSNPKPDVFLAKQVVRDPKMRMLMGTRQPPLHFLVVNRRTEMRVRRVRGSAKPVKTIATSYPIPIPKMPASSVPPWRGEEQFNAPKRDSPGNPQLR